MLIYRRLFIAYITQVPQVDIPTPIIDPKTRIFPLKSEKKPEKPQISPNF